MKIVKLSSENIKRLVAVEITPDGNIVTIGGKNGAGKTSVLDSIAYALGGKELIPSEPIRKGESEAKIEVDLGEYVVIRKFKREAIQNPDGVGSSWGETKSTLIVKNKDGATFPSPQAMLDRLIGRLSFDPLEFSRMPRRQQDQTLRELLKLDTTPLDEQRRSLASRRTDLKKDIVQKYGTYTQVYKHHPGVPEEPVPNTEVMSLIRAADDARKEYDSRVKIADEHANAILRYDNALTVRRQRYQELEESLTKLRQEIDEIEQTRTRIIEDQRLAAARAVEAHNAIPDTNALQAKLEEIEAINKKVADNASFKIAKSAYDEKIHELEGLETSVKKLDERKREMLEGARYPVEGLGLDDEGVTFNGLPLEQASTAEKLRVSVAIGLALNPTLRVLLIRDANALDGDSLKLVAGQAEAAEAQVWMEFVTESKDSGVQVFIEDGSVA